MRLSMIRTGRRGIFSLRNCHSLEVRVQRGMKKRTLNLSNLCLCAANEKETPLLFSPITSAASLMSRAMPLQYYRNEGFHGSSAILITE